MKYLAMAVALGLTVLPAVAHAQNWSGWAYGDLSPSSLGGNVGFNYGSETLSFGPSISAWHPFSHPLHFNRFTPELEAYIGMIAKIRTYYLWVYAGGGFYTDPELTRTGRLSVWWIDSRPVGLYASFYGMITPVQAGIAQTGYLFQSRLGMEFTVNRHLQIVPYAQLAATLPNSDVDLGWGCIILWSS